MPPTSYQGMKILIITISWHTGVISHGWLRRHDEGVSNDRNYQKLFYL